LFKWDFESVIVSSVIKYNDDIILYYINLDDYVFYTILLYEFNWSDK